MNILHVNLEYPPVVGGGAVEAHLLYREMAKSHSVTVITAAAGDAPSYEVLEGVKVYRCPVLIPWKTTGHWSVLALISFPFFSLLHAFRNRKQIGHIDIVNTWFAIPSGVFASLIAKIFSCPATLTLCGGDVYDPVKKMAPNNNPVSRQLVKFALKSHDAVTAISNDLADRAKKDLGYDKDIEVVPMGYEPREVSIATFRPEPTPFKVITICRLVERKGVMSVIQALAALKTFNFVYHIIGDGPQREALEQEVRKLDLEGKVVFEGYVTDTKKEELILAADIFILCSFHEGQCQAILEAAAHGLPIVTGDVGGQTDMVKDGINGLLVKAGSAEQISGALKKMFTSTNLRKEMGERNAILTKKYHINFVADRYTDFFNRILTTQGFDK